MKSLGVFFATTIGVYLGTVFAWATYAYLFHIYDGELDRIAFEIAPICGLVCGLLTAGVFIPAHKACRKNR